MVEGDVVIFNRKCVVVVVVFKIKCMRFCLFLLLCLQCEFYSYSLYTQKKTQNMWMCGLFFFSEVYKNSKTEIFTLCSLHVQTKKNVDTGQTHEDFRIQCIPYMKKNVLLMVFCSWFLSLLFYFFFNKTLFQNSILTSFYFFFEKKKINNTEHNLRRIFVLIWIFLLFCFV